MIDEILRIKNETTRIGLISNKDDKVAANFVIKDCCVTDSFLGGYQSVNRPDWDNYFLLIAYIVSLRSIDAQTKHGCCIVDSNRHIIGTGYNSFPTGVTDSALTNCRPGKYKGMMIHSELNAILNMSPVEKYNLTAYVTGKCCQNCLVALHQVGVRRIVMAKRQGTALETEETARMFDWFINDVQIKVDIIEPQFDWIKKLLPPVQIKVSMTPMGDEQINKLNKSFISYIKDWLKNA